jgi:hypothetical protein
MNFINPSPCGTWLSDRKKGATSPNIFKSNYEIDSNICLFKENKKNLWTFEKKCSSFL